jgi:uncharacterized surface protein with fasciclin (FAS1) repeats
MCRATAALLLILGLAAGAGAETPAAEPADERLGETVGQPLGLTLDAALGVGSFDVLSAALRATGLDAELDHRGPYTVFAPTDAAFEALPPGTIERLMRPENRAELARLVMVHLVPGEIRAADVLGERRTVTTLAGTPLVIDSRTELRIGGARALMLDVPATNGLIHVVDRVLLPQ